MIFDFQAGEVLEYKAIKRHGNQFVKDTKIFNSIAIEVQRDDSLSESILASEIDASNFNSEHIDGDINASYITTKSSTSAAKTSRAGLKSSRISFNRPQL